jgi:hypothetical protein
VSDCCCQVELHVLLTNYRVQSTVLGFGSLCIEDDVAHSRILVPQKVVVKVNAALIKISVSVLSVAILLVGVNGEVQKVDYVIFKGNQLPGPRIEVIRHVFVTFYVHKGAVNSEKGVQQGPVLKVSPKCLHRPICH